MLSIQQLRAIKGGVLDECTNCIQDIEQALAEFCTNSQPNPQAMASCFQGYMEMNVPILDCQYNGSCPT